MSKCAICDIDELLIGWQPFGPSDSPRSLIEPGYHYRGFPLIKICLNCADIIDNGNTIEFTYKKQRYIMRFEQVRAIPEYISDALAWSEGWD